MKITAAALILVLTGCASLPQQRDAFSGIEMGGAMTGATPFKQLRLAIVLSENTINSMAHVKARSSIWQQGINQDFIFTETLDLFQRHFRSLVKVDRLDQIQADQADLVMVLDIYSRTPASIFHKAIINIGAHFLTLDQQEISTVRAESSVKPRGVGVPAVKGATRRALDETLGKLVVELVASENLQAYAEEFSDTGEAPTAPKPAARLLSSTVDRPRYELAPRPDDFALVIGIDEYKNLPRAEFADRDATAMRSHLIALGYPERNIILLKGGDATRATLEGYLEEWLPRNLNSDSTVFFYYSGHGAPDTETGEAYLVPWDGNPQFLKSTAYPLTRLYSSFAKLPAKRVIVAMDACFSGAGGRSVLAKGARPLVTKIKESMIPEDKVVLFAASSSEEITTTLEQEGHGIFTYFFLKGLNGEAKDTRDQVTAESLYRYLKPNVQDQARRQNREQTPQFRGSSVGLRLR